MRKKAWIHSEDGSSTHFPCSLSNRFISFCVDFSAVIRRKYTPNHVRGIDAYSMYHTHLFMCALYAKIKIHKLYERLPHWKTYRTGMVIKWGCGAHSFFHWKLKTHGINNNNNRNNNYTWAIKIINEGTISSHTKNPKQFTTWFNDIIFLDFNKRRNCTKWKLQSTTNNTNTFLAW